MVTTITPTSALVSDGTKTAFSGSTTAAATAQNVVASCLIPPCTISGTRYASGILVLQYANTAEAGGAYLKVMTEAFNVATGAKLAILTDSYNTEETNTWTFSNGVLVPITSGNIGYIHVATYDVDDYESIRIIRTGGSGTLTIEADDYVNVTSISLIPKSIKVAFHVGSYRDTDTYHLSFLKETVNQSTGTGTITGVWHKTYTNADYAGWTGTIYGVLHVQDLPSGQTIAVIGGVASGYLYGSVGHYMYCDAPRLSIIDGGATGTGAVILSRAPGSGRCHGFVANQFGEIYTVGTQSLTGSTANLIERFSVNDVTTVSKSVAHRSNGLGDYYAAGQNASVRIINPIWDGSRLIVFDEDPDKCRMFVYDRDLTYISKATLSTTAMTGRTSGGSSKAQRVIMNKYCVPWWAEQH